MARRLLTWVGPIQRRPYASVPSAPQTAGRFGYDLCGYHPGRLASIASRPGSMYPCAHCRRLPYFICIAGIPRLSRLRALGRDDNGGVVADPNARPAHVLTARWSDDVAAMIDESAPQEGALHPTREMEALEGRVTLLGFRLVGAYHESLMRVDQRNVGVKARSNI